MNADCLPSGALTPKCQPVHRTGSTSSFYDGAALMDVAYTDWQHGDTVAASDMYQEAYELWLAAQAQPTLQEIYPLVMRVENAMGNLLSARTHRAGDKCVMTAFVQVFRPLLHRGFTTASSASLQRAIRRVLMASGVYQAVSADQ